MDLASPATSQAAVYANGLSNLLQQISSNFWIYKKNSVFKYEDGTTQLYVLQVHIPTLLNVLAKLCGHHINVYYISLKTDNTERTEMKVGRYCQTRLPPHSSIMAVS